MKYFHLFNDRKTVKEISWEEHRKLVNVGWEHSTKKYLLVLVSPSEIGLVYGKSIIWVPVKQLLQVLQSAGILKEDAEQ